MTEPVLSVRSLHVTSHYKKHVQEIIRGVGFDVYTGKCPEILGESGSGKNISLKAVMELLDQSFSARDEAMYQGEDLTRTGREELRRIQDRRIAMILRNPMTYFDPLYRIGHQMAETYGEHFEMGREEIHTRSIEVLRSAQIRGAEEVLKKYPHQLDGGMLQCTMIGLAISMGLDILIADRPTTAIDTITQYEIMKKFARVKGEARTAVVFISHSLGVIAEIADQVLVMNQGGVTDRGAFRGIMGRVQDPYTRLLVEKKQAVMVRYREALAGGGMNLM